MQFGNQQETSYKLKKLARSHSEAQQSFIFNTAVAQLKLSLRPTPHLDVPSRFVHTWFAFK